MVQRIQGRLLRRARRRPGALRMDRAVLRPAPHRGARRDQILARSQGPDEPRARSSIRRAWTTATLFRFKPGYRDARCPRALSTGASGAATTRPSRCATTTATAASSTPAPCVRRTARRSTRSTSRAAGPTRCASRCPNQLGAEGEEAVKAALDLCVSCKGCKRECPTGVDMARMKVEFLAHYKAKHGLTARDRAIGYLPRYAPWAARLAPLSNLASSAAQELLGFSPQARAAEVAQRFLQGRREQRRRCGSLRRYLQSLLRAGERARGAEGARSGGLPRACAARLVLRTNVPVSRPGGRGEEGSAQDGRSARALMPPKACRSSAWSRPACSRCATSSPSWPGWATG